MKTRNTLIGLGIAATLAGRGWDHQFHRLRAKRPRLWLGHDGGLWAE